MYAHTQNNLLNTNFHLKEPVPDVWDDEKPPKSETLSPSPRSEVVPPALALSTPPAAEEPGQGKNTSASTSQANTKVWKKHLTSRNKF